ncbi:MAG: glycosyltransferase [Pseudomonadota bacterium]
MKIDIVIIGLQCEATLVQCVQSILFSRGKFIQNIIYVDGGSTDRSVELAQTFTNIHIIQLNDEHPSPGAQRNAGWRHGTSEYVFFIDGDTIVSPYFIQNALNILNSNYNNYLGAVFGQRQELYPDKSIVNFIGNIEWNPPFQKKSTDYFIVHQHYSKSYSTRTHDEKIKKTQDCISQSRFTLSFGGDVLVRRTALEITGGYDPSLIAGEDPELALRFGLNGYAIWYEHINMTYHDLGYALPSDCNNEMSTVANNNHKRSLLVKYTLYTTILTKLIKRSYRTGYGYAAVGLKYIRKNSQCTSNSIQDSLKNTHSTLTYSTSEGHEIRQNNFIRKKTQESNIFWKKELLRIAIRGCGSALCILFSLFMFVLFLYFFLTKNISSGYTTNLLEYTSLFLCGALFILSTALGTILLLYPFLFSIKKIMKSRKITYKQARAYALYCSLVVLPQSAGLLRFLLGWILGKPLHNTRPKSIKSTKSTYCLLTLLAFLLLTIASCAPRISPQSIDEDQVSKEVKQSISSTNSYQQSDNNTEFHTKARKNEVFSSEDAVQAMSEVLPNDYLLGAGDVLSLEVWNRPKLSDPHIVVAPDGKITVMRIGIVNVAGRSIDDVMTEIETRLRYLYHNPEVRLSILNYKNNKAFVLGRVTSPGLIEFSGHGTLLEALSRAGGLPIQSEKSFLTKCAIIRGKNQILWIDLRDLLENGNMALNARIYNNDIIFIPESDNELVYVMGEVMVPGALQLKSEISYLDALMFSGGPTKSADLEQTFVIRFDNGTRRIRRVNLKQMLEEGDGSHNFVLKNNDVIYVSETGMASFNYGMQQLLPALEVLNLGTSVLERFGVMETLRGKWYGTEGFVDGD